jgi:alpha-N-arabinofuranosidase
MFMQVPAAGGERATTRPITPGDMADLVEYSFGDASTTWGRMRIEQDEHPAIYNWSFVELGNEQYNPDFVEQVAAMEARADKVGVGGKLKYLFPSGWNAVPQGVNATDAPKAAKLGLGDRLLCDLHTLDGYIVPPTRPLQMDLDQIGRNWGVPRFHDVLQSNTTGPQGWGALNLETNCGDHTLRRALEEGYDLNMFANEGNPRLKGRAASFCMERSGYQEGGLNDQGLVFFLPNMTWGQPPFYAHKMIVDTLQPNAVTWSMTSSDGYNATNLNGIVSSQVSDDGTDVTVRFVNPRMVPLFLDLTVKGRRGCVSTSLSSATTATMTILNSANLFDANTPAEPTAVSPVTSVVSDLGNLHVPAKSFAIITVTGFRCE